MKLKHTAYLLIGISLIFGSNLVQAKQAPKVNMDFFRPSVHPGDILGVQTGWLPGHLKFTAGAFFKYAYKPLAIVDASNGKMIYQSVTHQAGMDIYGSVSLWGWVTVGLDIPVYFTSKGDSPGSSSLYKINGGSLGDLRLGLKVKLFSQGAQGFSLALAEDLTMPTATAHNFTGDDNVTSTTFLAMDYNHKGYIFAFDIGYRARKNVNVAGFTVGDELLFSLGTRLPVWCKKLDLIGTAELRTQAAHAFSSKYNTSLDLLGGVDIHLPMSLGLMVAAGGGTTRGFGSPKARVVVGLAYRPDRTVCDSDGDGVPDDKDRCPKVAGPAELKGCPDTDKDGVADKDDQCPKTPGLIEFKGCPDTDKDGIEDRKDKCPKVPGLRQFDGCPDTDNDGIQDSEDHCPKVAGPRKYQGCPDSDGDGIIDLEDKCPKVRGERKYNGCPPPLVKITKKKIVIMQKVHFKTGSAKIMMDSYELLKEVAQVLNQNPQIKKIRIEGHTDSRGSRRFNMRLSKRRAKSVMKFLVKAGVDPNRLEYAGYGPTRPIASNKTRAGRAKNRRVEFTIIEQTPIIIKKTIKQNP